MPPSFYLPSEVTASFYRAQLIKKSSSSPTSVSSYRVYHVFQPSQISSLAVDEASQRGVSN